MSARLLAIAIEQEHDIVQARQRTRQIAGLLGFVAQDQTRITTAVSEIARNAIEYGKGGRIEYRVADKDGAPHLEIIVRDTGPGIKDIDGILDGVHRSTTGMGIGILGARRLMDAFAVETAPRHGTKITMAKRLPRAVLVSPALLTRIGEALAKDETLDPIAEIRRQNREMLVQLEELNDRQQQLAVLNEELQDTNRGVVALYAELNDRADHLRQADELKSRFLSNMSHEFRTPLNSILALTRLLHSRVDGDLVAGAAEAGAVHPEGGGKPDRAGERSPRSRQGRGRTHRRCTGRIHRRGSLQRAARHVAAAACRRCCRARLRSAV